MGVFNNFPYTNIHELNLDWVIKKIKELDSEVNEKLDEIIADKAVEYLSELFVNASYDPDTETISFEVQ